MTISFYMIALRDIEETTTIMHSEKFESISDARNFLTSKGYEQLSDWGREDNVCLRFVNLKYKESIKDNYFDAPRAEVIRQEIEI